MENVFHVHAEDFLGNSSFSRYYSSESWAERKIYELQRDKTNVSVEFRVMRGEWETISV